jgi:hypothetical protein
MDNSSPQDGARNWPPQHVDPQGILRPDDIVLYEGPATRNRKPVVLLTKQADGSRRIYARWYWTGADGKWWPRRGGVSLTLAQLNDVVARVRAIVKQDGSHE